MFSDNLVETKITDDLLRLFCHGRTNEKNICRREEKVYAKEKRKMYMAGRKKNLATIHAKKKSFLFSLTHSIFSSSGQVNFPVTSSRDLIISGEYLLSFRLISIQTLVQLIIDYSVLQFFNSKH